MKRLRAVAAAVLAIARLTAEKGCASTSSTDYGDASSPLDDPSTATCQDWLDADQDERDDTAQRFATALKAYDTSEEFAHTFAVGISKACDPVHDLKLPEAVAGIATLDTDDFPR